MVRTQIQLTSEQLHTLRRIAAERGVSLASLIREAVDQMVAGADPDDRWDRALASVGRYASGLGDLSEDHDRHLDDAYSS
jgi:Ribbon-helix-helix protein, copG family